jgi:phosphoribosylamine---glycine ligase
MKVLVVGGGGREHALAWTFAREGSVETVVVSPGNPGMCHDEKIQVWPEASLADLLSRSKKEAFDLVVIGPDQALADGWADRFREEGFTCFGPSARAARIESSKIYSKALMQAAGIPTARSFSCQSLEEGKQKLDQVGDWSGWVVKADGLALGKGVVVCSSQKEAELVMQRFLVQKELGSAGASLVVEERIEGREVSAFFLCDGNSAVPFAMACDHKRLFDGDLGPNTGGMGAYCPPADLPKHFLQDVKREVADKLLLQMKQEGNPFSGMLFIGLMVQPQGFVVLEFNARFGDPETQAFLPLLAEPLSPWLLHAAKGQLRALSTEGPKFVASSAVHLVAAACGYAEGSGPRKGDDISVPDVLVGGKFSLGASLGLRLFFAGVAGEKNSLRTNGGRVLGVTAWHPSGEEARKSVYAALNSIQFAGKQNRGDIALLWRASS